MRYAARCAEALRELAAACRAWPGAPVLERDSGGPLPRANLSVKVSALTPLLRPEAPERGRSATPPSRLRPLLREARELGAHLHVDMESLDSREAVLDLVLELLAEPEFRDGPSAGVVLQAYLRDSRTSWRTIARLGARQPPRTPRSPSAWSRAPTGTTSSSRRASTAGRRRCSSTRRECDRNFEALTRELLDARPARAGGDRLAQPALGRARDRLPPASSAAPTRDLELQVLRGLGDDLAAGARRRRACACARTARSATSSPGWPTSSAGCSRTPRNESFLSEQARRRARSRSCWPRPDAALVEAGWLADLRLRQRAVLELRRADRARRAADALAASSTRALPLAVPVLIGGDGRAAAGELALDRPGRARAGRRPGGRGHRGRRRRGGRRGAAAGGAVGARSSAAERAPGAARRGGAGCASGAWSSPRSRCASAPSRGRRPTPTCARRSTSSSTTRAGAVELDRRPRRCSRSPGERNELRYAPRGVAGGDLALELPARDPLRDDRRRRSRPATPSCSSPPSSPRAARCALVQALRAGGVPAGGARAAARRGRGRRSARQPTPACTTIAFTGSLPVGLEIIRGRGRDTATASATSSAWSPSWAARTA